MCACVKSINKSDSPTGRISDVSSINLVHESVRIEEDMATRVSLLVCLSFAVIATSNDIQRIYQNRISVIGSQVVVDNFEVVGLASIELDSQTPPTYFFDCNTTLNNGTGITWIEPLPSAFRVVDIPNSSNGRRLSIAGITSNDLGVYTCLDNYSNTTASVNITMENPAVVPVNRVLRVMQGSSATFRVYVSGYPLVLSTQIIWYRPNGTEIQEGDAVFEDGRRSLVLSNVQSSDAGMYACHITTNHGSSRTTIQLDVYDLSPLRVYQGRISITSNSQVEVEIYEVQGLATVELNSDITHYLDCNTSRNDGSGITWLGIDGDSNFEVVETPNGNGKRLSLSGLRESDLGRYECVDMLTGEDRAYINITIDNPAMAAVNATVEVLRGDRAVLEVYVSSYPLISGDLIRWYWPNGSEILEREAQLMNDGRSLFLVDVQPYNAGTYRCEVSVPGSNLTTSVNITLEVHVNSEILSHPNQLVTVNEWTETEIHCTASGRPLPNITWEKEGGATPPTAVNTVTYSRNRVTSVLKFDVVRYRDRGRFRCVVDNTKTPVQYSTYAEIRVTPRLLIPAINISDDPQEFRNPIIVADGAEVVVECTGSGQLAWTALDGQEISTDVESDNNLYQVYLISLETRVLHIRNFSSHTTAATYVCTTNITGERGRMVKVSVTLRGEGTSTVPTTASEQKADSVAAIVGGVMAGIILAMLIMLFVSVSLLIVVKGRLHEHAQVEAFTELPSDSGENGTQLMSVKSLELHSDSGGRSIRAGSSIEKLNDSLSFTATCTEKMNDIL